MSTLIKQQQVEEAKQGGLALNQSLQSAQKRQSWYKDQIDKGLSSNEIQNIVYMTLATVFNTRPPPCAPWPRSAMPCRRSARPSP